jgi:hypothetical protein
MFYISFLLLSPIIPPVMLSTGGVSIPNAAIPTVIYSSATSAYKLYIAPLTDRAIVTTASLRCVEYDRTHSIMVRVYMKSDRINSLPLRVWFATS